MPPDFKKVLTPTARTILEFVQFIVYTGTALIVVYHYLTEHVITAAQAAVIPQSSYAAATADRAIAQQFSVTINAINDLRADMNAVMDRLQIPDSRRSTGRHAIPVEATSTVR